jgi:zinc protease
MGMTRRAAALPRSWWPVRVLLVAVAAAILWPAAAAAQTVKWPSSSPPRSLPDRDVKFPPFQLRTLANGLSVVVVTHDEQPVVSLRLIVRSGGAQDPVGKPGVAAMVAALLDQGTTTRTAQQVADAIDFAGGDLSIGAGRDLTFANVTVMKDSLDLGIGLLADVVRRPAFADAELDRQRRLIVSGLQVNYQNPEYVAAVVFDRLVYGQHPYGLPRAGTPASLQRLTRDDLVEYHRRHYAPNNCLLAVVGDVTLDEAIAAVTAAFGDWPRREVPADTVADPPKPARRIVVVDKPDAVQTEIRLGQIGIRRRSNDFLALDLAIRILGGEGGNRVHRVLRNERGLTYGASVDADTLKRSGAFVARTFTRPETTAEAVRVLIEEFWRLRREPVSEEELSTAKAFVTGRFPLTIETATAIGAQVLEVLFYELPVGELQTFRQRVNAVTVDDVERVATGYLQPDRLTIVLVGNAGALVDQLKRAGIGRVEVIPLADLDVTAPDLVRKEPVGAPNAASGRRD